MTSTAIVTTTPPWLAGEDLALSEPTCKEDWRAYVDQITPPRPQAMTRAEYARMPELARVAFNSQRDVFHSALLIVETPMMTKLHKVLAEKMRINAHAPAGARRGVVTDGPATTGKSTMAKTFGSKRETLLRRKHPERFGSLYAVDGIIIDYCPVLYISLSSTTSPKDLSSAICHWFNQPVRKSANTADVTRQALRVMKLCGTELVIIDEVHFLDLSRRDGKLVNDHLKHLANHTAATFLYCGHDLASSGLFLEGRASKRATQTAARNSIYEVKHFSVDTTAAKRDWVSVIKAMEESLCLLDHEQHVLARNHWRYLHERTGGSIASLSELIRGSAIKAVEDGHERIDIDLMEGVTIDTTATRLYAATIKGRTARSQNRRVS